MTSAARICDSGGVRRRVRRRGEDTVEGSHAVGIVGASRLVSHSSIIPATAACTVSRVKPWMVPGTTRSSIREPGASMIVASRGLAAL